ncbi:hypothetical protein DPMN_073717 [Dreissena polymorpha]|uniref:Uncharacterized protein n=1 Tax=Dreissena polymorpha TaxID=45954 RepID=A0A9D4BZP4_DREPO|nr:hypothetical protein DPMN_073717 [Dreissena polymorpha]
MSLIIAPQHSAASQPPRSIFRPQTHLPPLQWVPFSPREPTSTLLAHSPGYTEHGYKSVSCSSHLPSRWVTAGLHACRPPCQANRDITSSLPAQWCMHRADHEMPLLPASAPDRTNRPGTRLLLVGYPENDPA